MQLETISSSERLNEVLNQWEVWDLTPNGSLCMQSIYGDMFYFQIDTNNHMLFVEAALAYEQDKDQEWRAIY
jgi:hypothetical protein